MLFYDFHDAEKAKKFLADLLTERDEEELPLDTFHKLFDVKVYNRIDDQVYRYGFVAYSIESALDMAQRHFGKYGDDVVVGIKESGPVFMKGQNHE